jgi:hypothetical protein
MVVEIHHGAISKLIHKAAPSEHVTLPIVLPIRTELWKGLKSFRLGRRFNCYNGALTPKSYLTFGLGDAFVITAYLTDTVKAGEILWSKK